MEDLKMSAGPVVHLGDLGKRHSIFEAWEWRRNKREMLWAVECVGEMMGTFLYAFLGIGSGAGWIIGGITKQEGLSSIFQIGVAYGLGIVLAINVCGTMSGAHFNPCVTIAMVVYKGFPKLKAVRYIVAQILGVYIASACVYYQWKPFIDQAEAVLLQSGKEVYDATVYTSAGPAGIFATYVPPGQTFSSIFVNEFVTCTILAIIVWASFDPTSYFMPPSSAPWIVGLAYGAAVWGFAVPGVALNSSRDIGGRLWAVTIWGTAASGGKYAALAALTNIPAMLIGVFFYEIFLTDSDRVVSKPHRDLISHQLNHKRSAKVEESTDSHPSLNVKGVETYELRIEKNSSSVA